MSKVYKSGRSQLVYSEDQTEFFTAFLRKIAPETADILETTVANLEREAKSQWPVRHQSRDKSTEERMAVTQQVTKLRAQGYSRQRARAAANDMLKRNRLNVTQLSDQARQELREAKSQRSIDRFETSISISPSGQVDASVRNTAPYAWAIKMGIDSRTTGGRPIILPLNTRISNELLWKPAKREAKKVASVIADEITKLIDRG